MSPFPSYSRGEVIADNCIHGVGVAAGLIAALVLIAMATGREGALLIVGVALYGAGFLAMLGCSALYNIVPPSPLKALFQRFDHAAIFIMIAGSYTPFTLNRIGGDWGLGLLAFVWSVALAGAAVTLFAPHRLRRISTLLYLLLGWSILAALDSLIAALSKPAIVLLVIPIVWIGVHPDPLLRRIEPSVSLLLQSMEIRRMQGEQAVAIQEPPP